METTAKGPLSTWVVTYHFNGIRSYQETVRAESSQIALRMFEGIWYGAVVDSVTQVFEG